MSNNLWERPRFHQKERKKRRAKFSTRTLQVMNEKPWGFWNNPEHLGSNLCLYSEKGKWDAGLYHSRRPASRAVETKENLSKLHRQRVTCPLCKRRLQGWIRIGHDGDFITACVPPHKPKKWWKK